MAVIYVLLPVRLLLFEDVRMNHFLGRKWTSAIVTVFLPVFFEKISGFGTQHTGSDKAVSTVDVEASHNVPPSADA